MYKSIDFYRKKIVLVLFQWFFLILLVPLVLRSFYYLSFFLHFYSHRRFHLKQTYCLYSIFLFSFPKCELTAMIILTIAKFSFFSAHFMSIFYLQETNRKKPRARIREKGNLIKIGVKANRPNCLGWMSFIKKKFCCFFLK